MNPSAGGTESARTVLILGGTGEAYRLAGEIAAAPGWRPLTSLAGRTRSPRQPAGETISGGFGGPAGMIECLTERRISAVIDATHPFAERISQNAAEACARAGVPLVRVERPPWPEEPGWRPVPGLKEAAAFFRDRRERVFLTVGKKELEAFKDAGQCFFLIRTIDTVESPTPIEGAEYIQGRGPFTAESEGVIMRDYGITWLVAKNSGGEAGEGKLIAAGELGVSVCMISRPVSPKGESVESVDEAMDWLARL